MSMLTMAPSPHSSFTRDYPWEGPRSFADFPPRRSEISLPSIRQAFPELQLQIPSPQDSLARTPSTTTSPTTVAAAAAAATPPEYTHSPNSNPNKRRRYSIDDEGGERASRVPRLYLSRHPSPPSQRTPAESWAGSAKTSPFLNGAMPVPSPPTMHLPERPVERLERRPNLPTLVPPHAVYEREQPVLRAKASIDDYPAHRAAPLEAPHHAPYRHPFAYHPFHHHSRMQSLSVGSAHPFERERYYVPAYGPAHYHPDFVRYGDVGHGGGDTRQRKRRGNLPKETTDKLRAWFVAHLHHPYPTEDEKQELMRQTGLQMNQISNWFINARRRQLPTMISNARAESDALHASREAKEGPEYDKAGPPTPLSEGESFEGRKRRGHVKRGSI